MAIIDILTRKSVKQPPIYTQLLLGICLFFAAFVPTYAANLIDIYKAALSSDPTYQAALSTRLSQREAIPQSVATLLPNISFQANISKNFLTQPVPGQPNQSQGYAISFTQPLINVNDWLAVKQANNTGKQADLTLAAAAQDLIFRVATAYFNVLSAQDTLRFTQAEKAADSKQLSQAQKCVQVGQDALTSVYDTKAAYDKSLAAEITAENNLRNNQEAMRQLTGQTYSPINCLAKKIPLLSPQPENIEDWINAATQHNLKLMAARYRVEVAREKIKMQASGHLPSLNLTGNYGKTDTFNNPNAYNENGGTLGLELDVPLFAGGAVTSKTHQAQYDFQTASANLDNTYRMLIINIRQKYNDVLSDISKIKAEQQAIKSAQLSLDSTEENYKAGTQTSIVDVLTAQQNLYDIKRTAASDQYSYLLDTLLLKQDAGSLKPNDLAQINQWLNTKQPSPS